MSQSWYSEVDSDNKDNKDSFGDRFLDFSELIENKLLNKIIGKIGEKLNSFIEYIGNWKFDH